MAGVWGNKLLRRKLLVFVDNDSARLGLIKAASSSRPSRDLILLSVCADADNSTISWYARVPSVSAQLIRFLVVTSPGLKG